jgi:uncharacterized protein (TIGR03435 family)
MRMASFVAGIVLSVMGAPVMQAQNVGLTPRKDADQIPSYEVVSIHKSTDANIQPAIHDDPDGLTATSSSLRSLIGEAYGFSLGELNDQQLVNAPAWAKTQLFDVHAKVDGANVAKLKELEKAETMMVSVREMVTRTPSYRMLMLQRLLEDRFKLKIHYEQRVMSLYEMTVAKGGVRMKAAHPADPEHGSMSMSNGKLEGDNVPMGFIPLVFAMNLERPVEDKTSTAGNFDFQLRWSGIEGTQNNPTDESAPSLFTAVQEQMGLKLQPGKGPVWVIVVDHAEMPSEN